VLAATARDLEAAVASGQFREDLYYQVSVFPICLPPLRERRDDIPLLAEHFVRKYSEKMGSRSIRSAPRRSTCCWPIDWPGNVRQLENCIEHAVLLSRDGRDPRHNLPPALQVPDARAAATLGPLKARVAILERDFDRRGAAVLRGKRPCRRRATRHYAADRPL